MPAMNMRATSILVLLGLTAALVLTGCGGGGGGGGGGGQATLAELVAGTSFVGFPGVPDSACQAPNGCAPPYPRNATLIVKFSGPISATAFEGFLTQGVSTTEQTFIGLVGPFPFGQDTGILTSNGARIEYFAFRRQDLARQAFAVFDDMTALPFQGILGVAKEDPRFLVFDPVVNTGNAFNLPFSDGFAATTQYDIFHAEGGLTVGGQAVPGFGAIPVAGTGINPAGFTGTPGISTIFTTSAGFVESNVPPQILDVTTQAILDGQATPGAIPFDDTIVVTFDPSIDPASIDVQRNLVVRNVSVTTSTEPNGVIVPMMISADPTNSTFMLTPQGGSGFGAGPYDIQVSVGGSQFAEDNILGLPSGVDGTQLPLANSNVTTFTTVFAAGQPTPASIGESFDTNDQEETVGAQFTERFNRALWNDQGNGVLMGVPIDGSALPNMGGLGDPSVGAPRTQFAITPQGVGTAMNPTQVIPFSAPFDDDQSNGCFNNLISGNTTNQPASCGTIQNPDGGNRLEMLYATSQGGQTTTANLPSGLADAIELYEWAAFQGVAFGTHIFQGFSMQMGHSICDAPNLGTGASQGLTVTFDENFNFNNPQNEWIDPDSHPFQGLDMQGEQDEAPILVTGPTAYDVGFATLAAQFIPFPLLELPFDFDFNRTELNSQGVSRNPNVLIDINTPASAAAPVPPTSNLVLGTNVNMAVPPRRLAGGPNAQQAFFLDPVVYHGRLTFVKKTSEAQTRFYDLGAAVGDPDFISLDLIPAIEQRPANTFITVELQAAAANTSGQPGTTTPWRTYIERDGTVRPDQLVLLSNGVANPRFFRARFTIEADTVNNVVPEITGFLLGYNFQ